MNRPLAALAALALLPAAAPATSITASRSHDPKLGCKAIEALVANLGKGRLEDPKAAAFATIFYSDRFGEVEEGEESAFLHALRHSEGKRDRGPIRLDRVYSVDKNRFSPIYLVVLERESWHETRLEMDGMLNVDEIRDPRYVRETSHWLARFSSNHISHFREAPEMHQLRSEAGELKGCHQD